MSCEGPLTTVIRTLSRHRRKTDQRRRRPLTRAKPATLVARDVDPQAAGSWLHIAARDNDCHDPGLADKIALWIASEHGRQQARLKRLNLPAGIAQTRNLDQLFDELRTDGFDVRPGALGENVTTLGDDLLNLPTGTRLKLGAEAVLRGVPFTCSASRDRRYPRGSSSAGLYPARTFRPPVLRPLAPAHPADPSSRVLRRDKAHARYRHRHGSVSTSVSDCNCTGPTV